MQTNEKNIVDYIRKEYESLTNPVYFQYGYQTHSESYHRLIELRGFILHFQLGYDSVALERDINAAIDSLRKWCDDHHSW